MNIPNKFIFCFLLISFSVNAQFNNHNRNKVIKKEIYSLSLTFIGGMMDGSAESLKWHYDEVDSKWNLNDSYWNPKVSYLNKYKNNNSQLGSKFPGSTTYLVWTTDGYHMLRTVRNLSITGSIIIHPSKKKKWYFYVGEFVLHSITYNAGFTLMYDTIYK